MLRARQVHRALPHRGFRLHRLIYWRQIPEIPTIVLGFAFAAFGAAQSPFEAPAFFAVTAGATAALSHLSFRFIETNRLLQRTQREILRRLKPQTSAAS